MGFDKDRFTGEVDDDFRCSICRDIIEDPIASQCEHVFCKVCIDEWLQRELSCPVDREPLIRSQLCEPSRFFRNFYAKLVIKCEFTSNGCKNNVKIENLKSHQNKCQFNPIVKHECEKGCKALLTRNEMIRHNCVEYLKSINIKLKDELEVFKTRETEHEELISELQIKIKDQTSTINQLKASSSTIYTNFNQISRMRSVYNSLTYSISSAEQKQLVESLKTKEIIKTPRVEQIMLSVDRKLFCSPDPYSDGAQEIGFGATISAPHIHGCILELIEKNLKNSSSVLDIGSGSGYLTICMAQMIGTNGKVIGIDHIKELIDKSEDIVTNNFQNLKNKLKFICGEGRSGYSIAGPYDVINFGGAIPEIPQIVFNQLKPGGRIIAPVGRPNETQELVTIDKLENDTLNKQVHSQVVFGSLQDKQTQIVR